MPVAIASMDNGLGVLFTCTGTVSGSEFIEFNNRLAASAKKRNNTARYCIIDYSGAEKVMLSSSDVEEISSQDKELAGYFPDFIVAIIAVKDLEYGVSRMWETFIELHDLLWETMVFKNRVDAEVWIRQKMSEKFNIDVAVTPKRISGPA